MELSKKSPEASQSPEQLMPVHHQPMERETTSVGAPGGEITSPAALPTGYPENLPYMDPEIQGILQRGMSIPYESWEGGIVLHPFDLAKHLSAARHRDGPDVQIRM